MKITTIKLIIYSILFLSLFIISLMSLNSAQKALSEIRQLESQNATFIDNIIQRDHVINQQTLLNEAMIEIENESPNENLNTNEPIISMDVFRLLAPSIQDTLDLENGFTIRAEIKDDAVNRFALNIFDNDRNNLLTIKLDDEFFDEGVNLEWTSFFLKATVDIIPTTKKGIFQIEDIVNNEVINFPVYFE